MRIYVAVEAAVMIEGCDVDKARHTSEILSKAFPEALTSSAVYGHFISSEGADMAERLGVAVHLRG